MIKKDTIVTCPNCLLPISKISRDWPTGEAIQVDHFVPMNQTIRSGEQLVCKKCNTYFGRYVQMIQIHTQLGWLPPVSEISN